MSQVTLLLGIHNHQPDGNFDEVFASGYDDCYARIVAALEEAPHVRCALHHTGALLEWIESHRPDYFRRLRVLVARGQVEILGGGFYEPMLAVLPERDALGQIAMMADYAERHFGHRPSGMWLAERVWEPGLPQLLAQAGIRYTLIDDGHFRYAGVGGPLEGYYVTEKAGAPVAIFPIDQSLRYAIPFQEPREAMRTVLGLRDRFPGRDSIVATYGDDGEKFGMWPGTKEWVWDKGWLREFFRLLGEHQERGEVRTGLFGEVLRSTPPSGRVYLPTASYAEMGEWALPADAQETYLDVEHALADRKELDRARPFLRGGIWQGFLAKYPEANFMHKKMLRVSRRVREAIDAQPSHASENALMLRELYKAQCNCSYWHGLFGGLYLNYLRDAVYRHLLVAEAFADAALAAPAPSWAPGRPADAENPPLLVEESDLDADLEPEIALRTPGIEAVIRPHEGGAIQELAYRPKTFMLTNVLARHPEGYHRKLRTHAEPRGDETHGASEPKSIHDIIKLKEPGLEKLLVYDRLPRYCFVDHLLEPGADLERFARGEGDLGDFGHARFRIASVDYERGRVRLERDGRAADRPVTLAKTYSVAASGNGIRVEYELRARGPLEVVFAPELSLTLLDGHSQERVYQLPGRDLPPDERVLASRGSLGPTPSLSLLNRANGFRVDLGFGDASPEVWRFPIETVSNSEGGFERTYQGSVIVPLFPLKLGESPSRITISLVCQDT